MLKRTAVLLTAALGLSACNTEPAPNTNPVANFTVTPTSGSAPLTVTTTNSSTDADTGDTLTYDWDWGDSSAHSTAGSPTHTYTATGNYTITLKATDSRGGSSTKTATITVTRVNAAPVANFTVTPTTGSAPLTVTTTNSSSDADTGDTLTYDWDWGDGSAHSTAGSPTHTYTAAGNYTITLKATDSLNASSTKTATVTVSVAAPQVSSTTPADGATCVKLDSSGNAKLTIAFSQPMNQSVPLANYFSAVPSSTGNTFTYPTAMTWLDNKTLEIPIYGLAYTVQNGTHAAATPREYAFLITNGAVSASGTPLGTPSKTYRFKTCVSHVDAPVYGTPAPSEANRFLTGAGLAHTSATANSLDIGFNSNGSAGAPVGAFLTFDLSVLPASVKPENISKAALKVTQSAPATGNPFGTLANSSGDTLQVHSVAYGDPSASGFSWTPFLLPDKRLQGNMGGATSPWTADVLAQVKTDWAAKTSSSALSQYQLRFANTASTTVLNDKITVFNSAAVNAANRPTLTLDYLSDN